MTKNRLNLNFALDTIEERNSFIESYIQRPELQPFTPEELETCANYILWGKDSTGKNAVQRKELQIERKNSTWTARKEESLEALLESPTFNENQLLNGRTPTKNVRQSFSREDALRNAPPVLRAEFVKLFHEIDEVELTINLYDLEKGKRTVAPRQELLNRFIPEEIAFFTDRAAHLSQYAYLKLRHRLVELRRQQYTMRDGYSQPIVCDPNGQAPPQLLATDFDEEIVVLPLGTKNDSAVRRLIFVGEDKLTPEFLGEEEVAQIVRYYWDYRHRTDEVAADHNLFYFDFRNTEHIYQLLLMGEELEDAAAADRYDCQTRSLMDTLAFYRELAGLNELQQEILDLKVRRIRNQDIADQVNMKYGKTYSANYISTIFKQKIAVKIAEAAEYHERLIQSLSVPEEFKHCNTCGRLLLIDPRNFVRKTRSKDGFVNRCKCCDKVDRKMRKEGKKQ